MLRALVTPIMHLIQHRDKYPMKTTGQSQQGIGLLELCLALAVIATLTVMAVRYYRQVQMTQRSDVAYGQVISLVHAVNAWHVAHGQYSSLGSAGVARMQAEGLLSNQISHNSWGGNNAVIASASGNSVNIKIMSIPTKACHYALCRDENGCARTR